MAADRQERHVSVAWRLTVAIGSTAVFRRFPPLGALAGKMHFALAPSKNIKGSDIASSARAACIDDVLGLQRLHATRAGDRAETPDGDQSGARGMILSARHAKRRTARSTGVGAPTTSPAIASWPEFSIAGRGAEFLATRAQQ
jgi:hypothetical protein